MLESTSEVRHRGLGCLLGRARVYQQDGPAGHVKYEYRGPVGLDILRAF
jgi:hypothetical protein